MSYAKYLSLLLCLLIGFGCAGSKDRPYQLISGAGPIYPIAAKENGVEGEVVVIYDLSIDGRVINAMVQSALPVDVFDEAALAAVRQWRFNPKLVDSNPQPVKGVVSTVRFRLDDAKRYENY